MNAIKVLLDQYPETVSDLAGLTKWIRMDSVIANMRKRTDGKNFQSVKTGIRSR
jgi:hypothetical protein